VGVIWYTSYSHHSESLMHGNTCSFVRGMGKSSWGIVRCEKCSRAKSDAKCPKLKCMLYYQSTTT